ncbi:DNA polymerase IV [Endozoicomonas sp. (ex Bugula neritina AB1)]|nr:DNA polymerase IV [Endozoicomonas sp. (ex Bugula neritina AB1)]
MTNNDATLQRKIIHVDFDAFFASIEIRDNPKLSKRPVAVGGAPARRGVIATCNYEARQFGVHSAMASHHAVRLCPELKIIPPRFQIYKEASAEAHAIFRQYTDLIEPLSLDEAYLDVSESLCCRGSATLMAQEIQQKIVDKLKITVSAGVAPNKFLAKIASDWKKPNGLFVIPPDEMESFIFELPVKKIHGVGKVTAGKLDKRSIITCGQLRQYSKLELNRWFGSFGERLWLLSRGIDDRPVQTDRRRKSQSVEHTYDSDLKDIAAVKEKIPALIADLEQRYEKIEDEYAVIKRFVKVKFADFTQTTLEESLDKGHLSAEDHFNHLMEKAWLRGKRPVRLLGVGVRLEDLKAEVRLKQLELFKRRQGKI